VQKSPEISQILNFSHIWNLEGCISATDSSKKRFGALAYVFQMPYNTGKLFLRDNYLFLEYSPGRIKMADTKFMAI